MKTTRTTPSKKTTRPLPKRPMTKKTVAKMKAISTAAITKINTNGIDEATRLTQLQNDFDLVTTLLSTKCRHGEDQRTFNYTNTVRARFGLTEFKWN